jgi:hypothetical protein
MGILDRINSHFGLSATSFSMSVGSGNARSFMGGQQNFASYLNYPLVVTVGRFITSGTHLVLSPHFDGFSSLNTDTTFDQSPVINTLYRLYPLNDDLNSGHFYYQRVEPPSDHTPTYQITFNIFVTLNL